MNAHGTRALLNAAREAGVTRFVHCSTVGASTGTSSAPPPTRTLPSRPETSTNKTKLEGERLVRSAAGDGSLEVVVVRPAGIYGPGDTRFLKLFRGIAHRRFPMLGKGTVCYHLTYIDDSRRRLPTVRREPARRRPHLRAGRPPIYLAQ